MGVGSGEKWEVAGELRDLKEKFVFNRRDLNMSTLFSLSFFNKENNTYFEVC